MKYIKEKISELDVEKIKMDLRKASCLDELASADVTRLVGKTWVIDRERNSYLCNAQVPVLSRESAISEVYIFSYENTVYELFVTGMFIKFSVQVNVNLSSDKWQSSDMQQSFASAFLELGLPYQDAANIFSEKLGIKFDNIDTVFEFSQETGK
ncbi:hypothetical protein ACO0LF_00370 [Undibacterium sp. Di27W]|uniref:hypothetical protein n=1 Tax=Undibacterium sp. Di27W TaxID=3413036 RepID=UPI003BF3D71D